MDRDRLTLNLHQELPQGVMFTLLFTSVRVQLLQFSALCQPFGRYLQIKTGSILITNMSCINLNRTVELFSFSLSNRTLSKTTS